MVKSVIGGFHKIPKKSKDLDDEFFFEKPKKKMKVNRRVSKFSDEKNTNDNYEEEYEDENYT